MNIKAEFSVEKIENGFIVRDETARRAVHVTSRFDVARQIERFMHDTALEALDNDLNWIACSEPHTHTASMQVGD